MRKVMYKVGRDGYFTMCNTLESAEKQKALDPKYTIEVVMTDVVPESTKMTSERKAKIEEFFAKKRGAK